MLLAKVAPMSTVTPMASCVTTKVTRLRTWLPVDTPDRPAGGAKMPDDEQIDRAVGGLQDQRTQKGQHEQGQLVQDVPLGKI